MTYKIINGSVSYGADTVLENIDFEIRDKEKIAIVGRNGCGKTTLLKAITGSVPLEEGTGDEHFNVIRAGSPTVGYMEQMYFPDGGVSMLDEILKVYAPITETEERMNSLQKLLETDHSDENIKTYSNLCEKFELLGGYTYKKEYLTAIRKFGFTDDDMQKPLSEFSGGQKTKIAFIKLLLSKPDILLLDEPTNHLDITAVEWLEEYLKNYKSAMVIVSHDRMFLDKIVNVVYEIEYGETKRYQGKYSDFERQKRENYTKQLKDYEAQRAEIARLMKIVERFRYKATKAAMAQSKLKQIEKMKTVDMPDRYDLRTFHADFQPEIESVKKVLDVKDLEIGYTKPLATVNFELFRGEKLAIIGGNGIGKSTFVKTLVGKTPMLSGHFEFGIKTKIGYFDQQLAMFNGSDTVFDEFAGKFPSMTNTEVRKALGAFLFSGDDVFKPVDSLSGGEKVRLSLCEILRRKPNVLILDEPTNHMDIVGKETLENMLSEYTGTLIFVSHDRYFVNKIADKLLVFDENGAKFYPFGFVEYEEMRSKNNTPEESEKEKTEKKTEKKGYYSPLKELSKKKKRAEKLETFVENLEKEISEISETLSLPEVCSDYEKVAELQEKLFSLEKERDEATEEWLILTEELEQ